MVSDPEVVLGVQAKTPLHTTRYQRARIMYHCGWDAGRVLGDEAWWKDERVGTMALALISLGAMLWRVHGSEWIGVEA